MKAYHGRNMTQIANGNKYMKYKYKNNLLNLQARNIPEAVIFLATRYVLAIGA